jgi:hypothetical protein
VALEAQDHVQHEEARGAERDHGTGVGLPPLLPVRVDAQQAVRAALHGSQDAGHPRDRLALDHPVQVGAEQRRERGDDEQEDDDLGDVVPGHQKRSARNSA